MKKYLDIRFVFEEKTDDDYTRLELEKIERVTTDLDTHETFGITETWAQSDHYWVDIASGLIGVIDGKTYTARD